MKRWKKLLALVLCAAVLYGGYIGVQKLTEKNETVTETSGSYPLSAKTADDVTGITWTKSDVTYDFVKTDGIWYDAADSAFPVDGSAVDTYVSKVISQTGIRKVENVTSLADYGLDEPAFTATLTYADGTTASFMTGSATPFGDGYYAMTSADATTVYTVSANIGSSFTKTMDDFASLEEMPSFTEADRIVIGTLEISKSGTCPDSAQEWYCGSLVLDDTKVESLISSIQALTFNAYAGSAENKADFGIPEDASITVYNGEEAVYTLYVGNVDSSYYAYVSGENAVYTISSMKSLLATSVSSLRRMTLVVPAFADAESFTLTAGESTLSYTAPAETEEGAEATESAETTEDAGTTDTTGADTALTEAAENVWTQVASLTATSLVSEYTKGEAVLTVQVTANGCSAEYTLCACNADSYLMETEDGALLFSADAVDKIIRAIRYQ